LIAAAAVGMSMLCIAAPARPALAQAPDASKQASKDKQDTSKPDSSKMEKRDLIIFQSGSKVEGVVLEETETTVRFLLIVGTMRSETTYSKNDILEIKRDEFKPEKKDDKKDAAKAEKVEDTGPVAKGENGDKLVDLQGKPIAAGATKIYIAEFRGEFGRNVSETPVKQMVDDIVRVQPDVLIVRFDHEFAHYGQEKHDAAIDIGQYDVLEKARELDTLLLDRIERSGELKKQPHTIAWVKKALGGAAFLPFTFREIYFTSDGRLGALGALEMMFAGVGDEVVRQKQRSLREGRARGLCARGGHDEKIMKAMSWAEYILSYRIVGGQVDFLEGQMPPGPEWFLLKDDGAMNKDHADTMQDRIRLQGNDFLTLDARTAAEIGFSLGTADNIETLLNQINITRNYAIVKNKSPQIFGEWSKNLGKAEEDITRLLAEFREVDRISPPGDYDKRAAARGRGIRIFESIRSIMKNYSEALNPRRVGDVDGALNDIDIVISRIRTAQSLDRR
jgi:hypothetical protein